MLQELFRAFSLVFIAEMGDKTQIIAMTFATQYKVTQVLLGVLLGVVLNHGIAILLGSALTNIIPMNTIQVLAGVLFLIFGFISLSIKEDDNEEGNSNRSLGPVATVALAFFIGELGDKTQLTALALSTDSLYPWVTLIGTTLAMLATSSLGIYVGSKIGDKIPETTINITSSIVFVFFGFIKLYTSFLKQHNLIYTLILLISVVLIEIVLIKRYKTHTDLLGDLTPYKIAAAKLKEQTEKINNALDSICIGPEICGNCLGKECLLGFIRSILKEAREDEDFYKQYEVNLDQLVKKDYSIEDTKKALKLIIDGYEEFGWDFDKDFIITEIRYGLEIILLNKTIQNVSNTDEYLISIKEESESLYNYLKKS